MSTTKQKPEAGNPAPKRKRAGKAARASLKETAQEERNFTDQDIRTVKNFLIHVGVPRVEAQEARRLGAPTVRPRDYYCGCVPYWRDWLPVCQEHIPNCRFAGRLSPREIEQDQSKAARADYDRRMNRAIKNYRGPTKPRGLAVPSRERQG